MPINPARILFEDDSLLVVDKLGGELVVKGKGRVDTLPLLDFLKKDYPGLKPVHRLDFETSGVVVFAKGSVVLEAIMARKFAGWRKTYRALVLDVPKDDSGIIRIPLKARSSDVLVQAQTEYRVLERFIGCSSIEATIDRGQFHQIRRHMAAIRHPLLLDHVYGNKKLNRVFAHEFGYDRFFLHAISIDFPHTVSGKQMHIEAPMPEAFERVLGELRKRAAMDSR